MINWQTIILAFIAQLPALIIAFNANKRVTATVAAIKNGGLGKEL